MLVGNRKQNKIHISHMLTGFYDFYQLVRALCLHGQRHLTMINISARCSDNEINIFSPEMKAFSAAAAGEAGALTDA